MARGAGLKALIVVEALDDPACQLGPVGGREREDFDSESFHA